jgi:excisionase family DNA binding protein
VTDPKTITVKEASDILEVSKSRVFQLIDAAGIVKHRVGNRCMLALSDIVEMSNRRDETSARRYAAYKARHGL